MWTRINLTHQTSDGMIDAVWSESTPDTMSEFLRFTVGTDEVVALASGELLQMKIYETGGDELSRASRGLITILEKRKTLPREFLPFEYPYDIAWVDQLSIKLAANLELKFLPEQPYVILNPGTALIFNIKSAETVPSTAHANTLFSYHVYLFDGSYGKYIELVSKGLLRVPVLAKTAKERGG